MAMTTPRIIWTAGTDGFNENEIMAISFQIRNWCKDPSKLHGQPAPAEVRVQAFGVKYDEDMKAYFVNCTWAAGGASILIPDFALEPSTKTRLNPTWENPPRQPFH